MKNFVVRNARPTRTVTLYGRTLAPSSVGGRTNTMALSLSELIGAPCVDLFRAGRIELVSGGMPEELKAMIANDAVLEASPAVPVEGPPPISTSEPEPVEPPKAPEPVVSDVPVELTASEEPSAPSETPTSTAPETEPVAKNTEESLKALTVPELRKIAKGYKLKASGTEDELIHRILDHEAGVS